MQPLIWKVIPHPFAIPGSVACLLSNKKREDTNAC